MPCSKCCCPSGSSSDGISDLSELDVTDTESERQNLKNDLRNDRNSSQTANNNSNTRDAEANSSASDTDTSVGGEPAGIGTKIKFFSEHTTMHGLDQIYASSSMCTKFFWLLVMLSVMTIAILQVQKMLMGFLENHTVTSISVEFPHEGLHFPSFTICPLLKLNGTAIRKNYNNKIEPKTAEFATASFLSAYSTALMNIGYFRGQHTSEEAMLDYFQNELDESLGEHKISLTEFLEDVAFDCRGQFLYCWFENGGIFDCCNNDPNKTGVNLKVKRYLLHSGPCFEFESMDLKQQLPGPVGGFGFVYWYPNNHALQTVFNSYSEHAIHMYTSPTEAMLEKGPVVLQVGTHSHISLQATQITRQMTDQLGRTVCEPRTLKYFDKYTYPSCQAECLIDGMLKECNCTGVSTYANIPDGRVCTPKEAFLCYKRLAKRFTTMLTACRREKCSEACQYWSYTPSITVGRVFNPYIEEAMLKYWNLPNNSEVAHSLIMADIYFNDIQYSDIVQMPAVTVESFISNIGGAMGLWTGASIITWIHLMFFCLSGWCNYKGMKAKKKRERREAQRKNNKSKNKVKDERPPNKKTSKEAKSELKHRRKSEQRAIRKALLEAKLLHEEELRNGREDLEKKRKDPEGNSLERGRWNSRIVITPPTNHA